MKFYNPSDWYWFVGGDQTQVFSSARGVFVPSSDASFIAWGSDGSLPTKIDTAANLGDVLAPYFIRPVATAVLDGYVGSLAQKTIVLAEFKIMFNHENRIRAIERALSLNGSPPNLTPAQAFNAVKALM